MEVTEGSTPYRKSNAVLTSSASTHVPMSTTLVNPPRPLYHRSHTSIFVELLIKATYLRSLKQTSAFMSTQPHRRGDDIVTPTWDNMGLRVGDIQCAACDRQPSHTLEPCGHTICYEHYLQEPGEGLDVRCALCLKVSLLHDLSLRRSLYPCLPRTRTRCFSKSCTCVHHLLEPHTHSLFVAHSLPLQTHVLCSPCCALRTIYLHTSCSSFYLFLLHHTSFTRPAARCVVHHLLEPHTYSLFVAHSLPLQTHILCSSCCALRTVCLFTPSSSSYLFLSYHTSFTRLAARCAPSILTLPASCLRAPFPSNFAFCLHHSSLWTGFSSLRRPRTEVSQTTRFHPPGSNTRDHLTPAQTAVPGTVTHLSN